MPSKNVIKIDVVESYYHVYARGINKQNLFLEDADYLYFLSLFERYLSKCIKISKTGVGYPSYSTNVELICYCLMSNHFHLLIYQKEAGIMSKLMRSIMTSYSRYFNLKYKRSGSVFESTYKASRIDQQSYLEHISRYIHLNPRYYKTYAYSSLVYFTKNKVDEPEWIKPQKILELFKNKQEYVEFVADYESHKQMLDELKSELADH
jgi:putative transposase